MQLDATGGLVIAGMQQQGLRLWRGLTGQRLAGFAQFIVVGEQAVLQGIAGERRQSVEQLEKRVQFLLVSQRLPFPDGDSQAVEQGIVVLPVRFRGGIFIPGFWQWSSLDDQFAARFHPVQQRAYLTVAEQTSLLFDDQGGVFFR